MKNGEGSVGLYISIIYRAGQTYMGRMLEKYNIGKGQFIFLMELYERDGVSQDDLAEKLCMDKGTTARAIAQLEENGYVTREKDGSDKRVNRVMLTEKAKDLETEVRCVMEEWADAVSVGFSDEVKRLSSGLLQRMAHNAAVFVEDTKTLA